MRSVRRQSVSTVQFGATLFAVAVIAVTFAITPALGSTPCGDYDGNKCVEVEICGGVGGNRVCETTVRSWYHAGPILPY